MVNNTIKKLGSGQVAHLKSMCQMIGRMMWNRSNKTVL